MHVRLLRRRVTLAIPVLGVVCLLAIGSSAAAIAAASQPAKKHPKHHVKPRPKILSLAGTWSGRYNGAYTGTFTLTWKQSGAKLTGTIALSNPKGKYGIGGKVSGKAISFGAVGVGATYTGTVSGKSMSGSWKSPQGGGSWSAKKSS